MTMDIVLVIYKDNDTLSHLTAREIALIMEYTLVLIDQYI